ncbi:unnamed protein product [Ectocarpus sp. 13 AM-2016]
MLEGTFPIVYRAVTYFTPVEIYISENYPTSPPMCYIRPTAGMKLKVGHRHVDQSGLVYLPYLHEWAARTHNLVELIANMSGVFGAEPPLFAGSSREKPPIPDTSRPRTPPVIVSPEEVRKRTEKDLTAKLQSELQAMYAVLRTDMDSAFETQGQLEESKEEVERDVEELSRRKKELERLLQARIRIGVRRS